MKFFISHVESYFYLDLARKTSVIMSESKMQNHVISEKKSPVFEVLFCEEHRYMFAYFLSRI